MKHQFKPRHITAIMLSLTWLMISLVFIIQGTMLHIWIPFAAVALVIGALAVWVLLNDRP